MNEEFWRREWVIRTFPNTGSALQLVGALPAEQNETWAKRRMSGSVQAECRVTGIAP
ncbi:MAG: transposase [Acidiferrobacteraceae bacterium]